MEADIKGRCSPRRGKQGGARRLIAGLRVTKQDEALLDVVRPFLPEAGSEGELAYRLWRRGLELTAAEAVSLGVALPPGITKELIAGLIAQRILLCVPLLQGTGKLALVGVAGHAPLSSLPPATAPPRTDAASEPMDEAAAAAIVDLGGSDFL